MKVIYIISLLILYTTISFGQVQLAYNSDHEQKVFENIKNLKENSSLDYLLAAGSIYFDKSSDSIQIKLADFYAEISKYKLQKKSEKKRMQLLFGLVQKKFLKKYAAIASFEEIFTNGQYNCVSGSGLYALIFDHYQIPYQIKELPTHVYLVAYPQSHKIIVESTDADSKGHYFPSSHVMEKFVGIMTAYEVFSKKYVEKVGYKQAFKSFIYDTQNIGIARLSSFQYYNLALLAWGQLRLKDAWQYIEKANMLNPDIKYLQLKLVLSNLLFTYAKKDDPDYANYLISYANLPNLTDLHHDLITLTFHELCEDLLIKSSQLTLAEKIFSQLNGKINDDKLYSELGLYYYSSIAIHYRGKGKYLEGLEMAIKGYELNTEHTEVQQLVIDFMLRIGYNSIGTNKGIEILDKYSNAYPFIAKHPEVTALYAANYSRFGFLAFNNDDELKGLEYMALLEDILNRKEIDLLVNDIPMGMIYAEAGAHYYRNRQYIKAKEIMEKGLTYYPSHSEIKARLEIVMEELE